MSIVSKALVFATHHHQHQYRKGTRIPYMSHLLNVCKILAERDCDDYILAAALLHDVVEDTEATIEEVEQEFGAAIADIVRGVTEQDKLEKQYFDKRPPWKTRKEHTIHYLLTDATEEQLLVACADKLDNMRSIVYDEGKIGDDIWARFHAARNEQGWYYSSLADIFQERAKNNSVLSELAGELKELTEKLFHTSIL